MTTIDRMDKVDRLILRLKELEEECNQAGLFEVASEIGCAVLAFKHAGHPYQAECERCSGSGELEYAPDGDRLERTWYPCPSCQPTSSVSPQGIQPR